MVHMHTKFQLRGVKQICLIAISICIKFDVAIIKYFEESVGVSRGYTDYHQGRAIHMADSRID